MQANTARPPVCPECGAPFPSVRWERDINDPSHRAFYPVYSVHWCKPTAHSAAKLKRDSNGLQL